jgi:hypothetical protein
MKYSYCIRWERDKYGVVWIHISEHRTWRQNILLHDRSFEA